MDRPTKPIKIQVILPTAYKIYVICIDWSSALISLQLCLDKVPDDGPCLAMKEYIEKKKNPPDGWLFSRDIDEIEAAPSMSEIRDGFEGDDIEGEENQDEDDDSSS